MLEIKGLKFMEMLNFKKSGTGRKVGVGLGVTAVALLTAGAGLYLAMNQPEPAVLDMSLADESFALRQTFEPLIPQPMIMMNGVDLANMTRGEQAGFIGSQLTQIREKVVTAHLGETQVETTLGALGAGLDQNLDEILDQMEAIREELAIGMETQIQLPAILELGFDYSAEAVNQWAESIAAQLHVAPLNASLRMHGHGNFQVSGGQEGRSVLTDQFIENAHGALSDLSAAAFDLEIPVQAVSPARSAELLATVSTRITGMTTQFPNEGGRGANVRRGANIINGAVIMPGETFNYNSLFPAITTANGFHYATAFIGGVVDQTPGGGLCQVSSTLYGAVLRMGIVPTVSRAHTRRVHYVPGGLDACMWSIPGSPCNVVFTNPYDFPLYLSATTSGGNLTVEFWSQPNVLGPYSFVPRSSHVSSTHNTETWNSWLRTYRNGSFVSERFLRNDVYCTSEEACW